MRRIADGKILIIEIGDGEPVMLDDRYAAHLIFKEVGKDRYVEEKISYGGLGILAQFSKETGKILFVNDEPIELTVSDLTLMVLLLD